MKNEWVYWIVNGVDRSMFLFDHNRDAHPTTSSAPPNPAVGIMNQVR
jgi:hypothetical protein